MESNMRKIMEQSWRDWHGSTIDDFPNVNMSYEKGFNACHNTLMPLLIESSIHVLASQGADHLTDGFRPQRRPIDGLVERIKAVLP